jgi:sigma-B regulation protein RsbU (phosphoserine phosphatase)
MPAIKEDVGTDTVPTWHAGFLRAVPAIERHASSLFWYLGPEEREAAIAEVTAVAMIDYLRNSDETEPIDPAALAFSAALHVRHSERACGRESTRDVLSPTAHRQRGFTVEPLRQSRPEIQLRTIIDRRRDRRDKMSTKDGTREQSRLAQERSRRRDAEKQLNNNDIEFEAARRIQERLLPAKAPVFSGFDVAGLTHPAEATGGDYFDYVPMMGDRVGVVVGDASGHGFGPALIMASTRAYLRAFAQTQDDLGELLALVNRVLTLDIEEDRFVTLVLARLDPVQESLVYASAGHTTGYVLDAAGRVRLSLLSTGPLLGIGSEESFSVSPRVALEPGELVILLSDGVLEASAPDGEVFGWSRAVNIVRIYRHDPAMRIAYNLFHAVRAFSQNEPQLDDITAVVIKVRARSGNGGPVLCTTGTRRMNP